MNNNHKSFVVAVMLAIAGPGLTLAPTAAHAQWTVIDPANLVQNILTSLRAIQSNVNEAKQLQQQIQQLENMLRNTKSLNASDLNFAIDAISRLDRLMREGQALAITAGDYDTAFKTAFPGYRVEQDYSESYRQWNATSRDSLLGAMRAANLQVKGIRDEEQALAALKRAVLSTDGQKQALDAGNQVALAQVAQLQQLRELMLAQMQAQGTHLAAEQQAEAAKKAALHEAMKYRDPREGFEPKPIKIGP